MDAGPSVHHAHQTGIAQAGPYGIVADQHVGDIIARDVIFRAGKGGPSRERGRSSGAAGSCHHTRQ